MEFKAMKRVHKLLEIFPPDKRDLAMFSELSRSIQKGYIDLAREENAGYKQFDFRDRLSQPLQKLLGFLWESSQNEADYHLKMEEVFDFFVPTKTVTAQDMLAIIDTHPFDDEAEMMALDFTEIIAGNIGPEETSAFALKMMFLKHATSGSEMVPNKVFQHIYMPLVDSRLKPQEIKQILMEIYNYVQNNHGTIWDRGQANKERMRQEREAPSPQTQAPTQGAPDTAKALRDAFHASIAKRNADSVQKYREQLQTELDALTAAMDEKIKVYEAKLNKNAELERALYDIENS
jgi:hypothetical protein